MEWFDLRDSKPVGDRCVILFPTISDVGILYVASNAAFARKRALDQGFTHFAYIDPAPGEEDAKYIVERLRRLQPDDEQPET